MAEQHSFIFPIANLRTLVEKRTTVLGANRSADGEPHQIERLSMTKGEKFLFDDYLQEAAAETYNWIHAFGRNVSDAFRIYRDGAVRQIKENDGVRIEIGGNKQTLPSFVIPLNPSMYNATYQQTLSDAIGDEIYMMHINLPNILFRLGNATQIIAEVRVHYTTLADGLFEGKGVYGETWYVNNDGDVRNYIAGRLVIDGGGDFKKTLKSIDDVEVVVTHIKVPEQIYNAGEYVEYTTADDNILHGVITEVVGNIPVIKWLHGDLRDSIVYKVELPDWQDRNMLPLVENHLQEAIVNYIMWRWFENTNPKEAEVYYEKWEDKAHKAQLGLNAEQKVLQRKSTWL